LLDLSKIEAGKFELLLSATDLSPFCELSPTLFGSRPSKKACNSVSACARFAAYGDDG